MQCASKYEFPAPFQIPYTVVEHAVGNFQLSQHFVYQCAMFLIFKTRAMPKSFLGNQRKTSSIPIFHFWVFCFYDILTF
jgi:hypothetical protein